MMLGNRMLSTAPCFEDVLLFRCLVRRSALRYAEFDPADPVLDSVSQWFDLLGWPGVIAVAGERERWQAARPNASVIGSDEAPPGPETGPETGEFGFIRFAIHRADAGALVATMRPLIVVAPPGLGDVIPGYLEAHGDQARVYLVRADEAEIGAPLRLPLRRDEFRTADAQAGTLGRMLAARESMIAAMAAEAEAARARMDAERARSAAEHEAARAGLIAEAAAERDAERRRMIIETGAVAAQSAAEIARRDRRIGELDRLAKAREAETLSYQRKAASLREQLAAAQEDAARLRPSLQELDRLTNALDWPGAPRAVGAVLPLARLLRRASYLIIRWRTRRPAPDASDARRHR